MDTKVCSKCGGDPKPLTAFSPHADCRGGVRPECRACQKAANAAYHQRTKEASRDVRTRRAKAYYEANKAEINAKATVSNRLWAQTHREESRRRKRVRYEALRVAVIALLGGRCTCGFDDPRAVQIDHVNGGGTAELRSLQHETWYRKILRGEAPSPVQLRCATCNWRKRLLACGTLRTVTSALRRAVVVHLGARCPCGETDVDLLHIDHVHGGGSVARRSQPRDQYYRAMLTAPLGEFQVLCPNCNYIKKNTAPNERPGPRRAPPS